MFHGYLSHVRSRVNKGWSSLRSTVLGISDTNLAPRILEFQGDLLWIGYGSRRLDHQFLMGNKSNLMGNKSWNPMMDHDGSGLKLSVDPSSLWQSVSSQQFGGEALVVPGADHDGTSVVKPTTWRRKILRCAALPSLECRNVRHGKAHIKSAGSRRLLATGSLPCRGFVMFHR